MEMNYRKSVQAACAAMVITTTAFAGVVAPASAAAVRREVSNRADGKCLDVTSDVSTKTCTGASGQKWTINPNSSGESTFVNYQTGLCLDSNSSGSVYAIACNGGAYQRWYLGGTGGMFIHNAATERCLESAAGNVTTARCDGSKKGQTWLLS
ncbi:RICIN domain-containing protein [Micromonospora antibiotica]|uniref:Ricin-type beta-trefoil lectin domain protein n=1 Tax=Micromonospora antibiotica TaxID=2807623 RepID=A0ABS3VFH8_9ACTN|nr:RICIN domain-containing protein [Micromonospora antibiotica]MBO4164324.1 ricin-type beta-trefoil lectin domain protein [Micromonospora antibiotica]